VIAREPERVAAAIKAIVRAQGVLRKDPARATEVGQRRFPPPARRDHRRRRRARSPVYDPRDQRRRDHRHERIRPGLGLLKTPVSYEDVVATRFRPLWTK